MIKSQPLLVTVQWPHHDDGGYGRLADYLQGDVVVYPFSAMVARTHQRLWATATFNARLFRKASTSRLLHLLYGDTILAPALMATDLPLVATLHLPVAHDPSTRWVDRTRDAILRRCSGLIALSTHEAESIQARFAGTPVAYIPHGIDTTRYSTDAGRSAEPSFVTVGCNYRDWNTLNAVILTCSRAHPNWRFHLVGVPKERVAPLVGIQQVVCHPRLSSGEYRDIIGASWAMFLPVEKATANNAVLETHALGTPLISSAVPGVTDYAVSTTKAFHDVDEAVDLLRDRANSSESTQEHHREATIRDASRFDWRQIAREVKRFHTDVLRVNP